MISIVLTASHITCTTMIQHDMPSSQLKQAMPTVAMPTVTVIALQPQQEPEQCIRNGCTNPALEHDDWEDGYCSNLCVVEHCKDVFENWVKANNNASIQNSSADAELCCEIISVASSPSSSPQSSPSSSSSSLSPSSRAVQS